MVFNLDCTLENTECFEENTVRLEKNNRTSKFLRGMSSHWESGHNSPTPFPEENCATHTHTHTHTHPLTNAHISKEYRHPQAPQSHLMLKHTQGIKQRTQATKFSLKLKQLHTYHCPSSKHRPTCTISTTSLTFLYRFTHTFTRVPTLFHNILISHKITNNAQLHRAMTTDSQPQQFYHRQPHTHTLTIRSRHIYPPIGSCTQPGFSNHTHTREHSHPHN